MIKTTTTTTTTTIEKVEQLDFICDSCGKPTKHYGKGMCRQCYNKQWKTNHKDYISNYNKTYNENLKGFTLYLLIDNSTDRIMYVGKSTIVGKRLSSHINGSVPTTKDFITKGDYTIKTLDVSHIVNDNTELLCLEDALIKLYKLNDMAELNTRLSKVDEQIQDDRLFSILSELHSLTNEWTVYYTTK